MERESTESEKREQVEIEQAIRELKRIEAIVERERAREEERRRGEEQRREWERQHMKK